MREPISQTLYAYWNDIRAGRLAPRRFEIEPSQIAGSLPNTFILERIDDQTSRFRLAGTRLYEIFGREFRGANFFDLVGPGDALWLQRQFSVITGQGAVGVFRMSSETATGKTLEMETLLLPLTHMHETVDRLLGSIAVVRSPVWLGDEPLIKSRIIEHNLIWPDGRPHAMIDKARRQEPFIPQIGEARIVRGGRRQFRVFDGGLGQPKADR